MKQQGDEDEKTDRTPSNASLLRISKKLIDNGGLSTSSITSIQHFYRFFIFFNGKSLVEHYHRPIIILMFIHWIHGYDDECNKDDIADDMREETG